MIGRLFVIGALALAACATTDGNRNSTAPDAESAATSSKLRYTSNPGPTPVGAIPDIALRDPDRNRDIMLNIEYPTRGEPHPLLIWSHAGGGSHRSYVGLSSYWAGYGFVVIRLSHGDSPETQQPTEAELRSRVQDVTFLLSSLDTLEQRYPELQGKIDRNRIGVGGHARGAVTALQLAAADARVKAVVAMSPPGPRESWGVTPQLFAGIKVPVLFMTGTLDRGPTEEETPEWRRQAFELAAPGDTWLIVMEGARLATFTGRLDSFLEDQAREAREVPMDPNRDPRADPRTAEADRRRRSTSRAQAAGERERSLFGMARTFSLAFWDAYLRNEAGGREHLEKAMSWPNLEVKKK